ncbi:hypothetical protein Asphe3_11340 [Pseudarthrobacter phenanthrenivorans Sphe3]|uniref:Mucin-associated surface protein n=1 Tax=Pseudarthrobacter phenanthrenivorans (strain DSM 18606 / JCM 16027 / LMG 23796 / Sphe3) TaxID=930171 RepID=F0M4S0_PSEPM|nr:hypothetical protein [Pseudarthrobacter phenanthrenivorans]ADX72316.1 hypothetical protein Asphe3_11340 [Pseudarthrobacter phenanthrenivorans Sphe3]
MSPALVKPRRILLGISAALLAAGLLGGCGANETGLQRDAARQLQARVLEVTQASSQNDPAAALKALEGLEAELDAAQAEGKISEDRRRSINTVVTAVRADLNEAVAAAEKAAADKAAEEARIAQEQAAAETPPPAVQTPAPAPVPVPAPAPAPAPEADKKDNEGKGKGND